MLKELIAKIEKGDACHDFIMKIELGEEAEVPPTYDYNYPSSEFMCLSAKF